MYSAIDEHDLELHLVHEKDGSPIGYRKVCKKEGKEVPADEIVKAYEVEDGELVYLTDEDFRRPRTRAYRTIEVLDFVPHDEIDPIVFQRTYYLGPAEGAEKVYALLVKAMEGSELSAVARYVFHDRQQLGALRIRDGVITLENMYFADEIRPTEGHRPGRSRRVSSKRELEMAQTLIERFTYVVRSREVRGRVSGAPAGDRQAEAKGRRGARAAGGGARRPTELLEALRASVEAAKGGGNRRGKRASARRTPRRKGARATARKALLSDATSGSRPARLRKKVSKTERRSSIACSTSLREAAPSSARSAVSRAAR